MEGKWQHTQVAGRGFGLVHLVPPKTCWIINEQMVPKAKAKFPVKDGSVALVSEAKLAAEGVAIAPEVVEETSQLDDISTKDYNQRHLPADPPICGADVADPSKPTCVSAHGHGSRIWIILLLAVLAGLALMTTH